MNKNEHSHSGTVDTENKPKRFICVEEKDLSRVNDLLNKAGIFSYIESSYMLTIRDEILHQLDSLGIESTDATIKSLVDYIENEDGIWASLEEVVSKACNALFEVKPS